ncbi:MAG: HAMP domain-containing histidine kinase [Chitinophagales bacterium]|nr:HAMP domain-containing histidine kinase [Hyphomicrobiales bacterium]
MDKYVPIETFLLSTEPVWVWNSDTRTMVWSNTAAKLVWGAAALPTLETKSAALKKLLSVARRASGSGQWSGRLEFSVDNRLKMFSCQLQKLELNGGHRGVVVRMYETVGDAKLNTSHDRAPSGNAIAPAKTIRRKLNSKSKSAPDKVAASRKSPERKTTAIVAPRRALAKGVTRQTAKSSQSLTPPTKPRAFRAKAADLAYLAGLSHDLRNPLTAIIGFAEMMKGSGAGALPPEKMAEYAADISRSALFALDMANELIGYARGEPKTSQQILPVKPQGVAAECMRLIAPLAEQASLSTAMTVPKNLPLVAIPERNLKQILLNLLLNSVKFTAPGGQVRLKIALNKAGALVIAISDTGGADPSQAAIRAGETTAVQGAGLGIVMVKRLLKEASGKLHRQKRASGGMLFKVIFLAGALTPPNAAA